MDVRTRLAVNMKRLRKERGWSQEEFADRTGLHRTYISAVERGVRNPTLAVLARIYTRIAHAALALETP